MGKPFRSGVSAAAMLLLGGIGAAAAQSQSASEAAPDASTVPTIPLPERAASEATQAQPVQAVVSLPEVLVTSQKMSQTLEQVPASVSALPGELVRDSGASGFQDLQEYTANVTIRVSGGAGQYSIRGFGTPDTNTAFDPSVGTVVDGVYYGRSNFLAAFFNDVERFEVLRGPQGTLFGKNNTAGLFNLVTEAPQPLWQTRWELFATDNGERSFRPVLNFPLGDALAIRLSGNYDHGDRGTLFNTTLKRGERNPQQDTTRLRLRYHPTTDLTVEVGGFYSHQLQNFNQFQFTQLQPNMAALVSRPEYDPNCNAVIDLRNCANYPSLEDAYAQGANATFDVDMGHTLGARQMHFLSISSWGSISTPRFDLDADFSPVPFITDTLAKPRTFSQWSQEFHLSGEVPSLLGWGQGVTFVFGIYYFQSHFRTSDFFNIQDLGAAYAYELAAQCDRNGVPVSACTTAQGLHGPLQTLLTLLDPLSGQPGIDLGTSQNALVQLNQHARDYAAFGQAEHRITDEWSLIGGLRFDIETKDGIASSEANGRLIPLITSQENHNTRISRIEHQLSPKAGFKWAPSKHVEAYATWTRGFKSGGFNALPLTRAHLEYEPESATSIEIGGKVRAYDGALRFSGAVFTTAFDNLQVSTFQNNSFVVENAASARSRGFEVDLHWYTPLTGLSLYTSLGLADAKYRSYPCAPSASDSATPSPPQCQQPSQSPNPTDPGTILGGVGSVIGQQLSPSTPAQDLSGQPLSFAPKWTATFIPTYEWHLPRYMVAIFSVDVLYRGQQYLNPDNDPRKLQPAATLINGRVGLGDLSKNWKLTVVGHNLTNKIILDQFVDQPLAPGNLAAVRSDRGRFFSANLTITF